MDKTLIEHKLLDNRKITNSGCWEWQMSLGTAGYGQVNIQGEIYTTHRLAAHIWLDFDLDSHLHILHKCDNKLCINPEHLYEGTPKDNARDKLNASNSSNHWGWRKKYFKCGHSYTRDNFVSGGIGYVKCKTCVRARDAERYLRRSK